MKLEGGIDLLQGDEREAAENYFHRISDYEVFVVPGGELESWLPSLGVPGKGTDWTLAMLEKLGDDPTSSDYIRPADDDVWQFLRSVLDWISDPSRKGVK